MADTITTYIGNGTQTDFSIPFDYLKKSFIKVTVDGTLLTGGDYGDTSVDYYFLDNTTVRLKVAPASEAEVIIRRYTSATERIVSFEDASILKATDLDTSQLQSFHIAEEARDVINDAMVTDSDGNWDAQGNRIVNVGDPVDGGDAINLDWYNEDAGKVQENANKTEQWRNETEGFRNEAEGFKDNAEESYNLAKDWAIKMDGKVVEDDVEGDYSAKYWATSIKEYGEASLVVADNIDDVKQVSTNIEDVKLVGGDLEGSFSPPDFTDMGRVGTGSTNQVEITGGNIKIVADNIEGVQNVGTLIESGQVQVIIDSVETTNQNVIKAKQSEDNAKVSETNAKASENSAKDWAVKMDGLVNNEDYSSKYYAQQAKTSADTVTETSEEITQAVTEGLENISTEATQGVSQVTSTYEQGVTNLGNTTQQHLTEINQAGTTNVSNVNQTGTTQIGLVEQEGTEQVALVTAEGTKQVQRVEDAGDAQVELVGTAGTTALGKVNTAGTTQTKAVNDAGTTQVGLVTAEGTKQVGLVEAAGTSATEAVSTAKDSAVATVTSTGTSQVKAVNTASSTAQSTINNLVSTATTNINVSVQKAQQWAEKTDGPVEEGKYSAKYWADQASFGQVQADWNEADDTNVAYIKNKPDLTVYALKTDISTIYRYKGSVDTYSQLPVASQVVGDVYNIATDDSSHGIKAGDNVAWNGSYWDNLSGYVDLSPYLTIENAANLYLRKDTAGATYATKSELSSYATVDSLSSYATTSALTSGLATKVDTSTYTADKATFALKTQLNSYALKTEIPDVSGFQTKTQHDADIQELATELDGKAPSVHTHTVSQVTDFTAQVQSLIDSSRITDYGRVGS